MNHESLSSDEVTFTFRQKLPRIVGYLVAWLAYLAITLWLAIELRNLVVDVCIMLRFNPWQVRAVDNFVVIPLVLGWLAGAIAIETYLRNGIARQHLWRRVGKTYLTVLIVIAAELSVKLVLP